MGSCNNRPLALCFSLSASRCLWNEYMSEYRVPAPIPTLRTAPFHVLGDDDNDTTAAGVEASRDTSAAQLFSE